MKIWYAEPNLSDQEFIDKLACARVAREKGGPPVEFEYEVRDTENSEKTVAEGRPL